MRTLLAVCAAPVAYLLTLPVIIIGLPFWTVAFFTRIIARLLEPRYVDWEQLIEFDPAIGWKPKANFNGHYFEATEPAVFHITTDSEGWVGSSSLADSDIVVFGDSFAFPYGIDFKASYLSLNSHLHIKAIGAPGYNLVQELLLMRQVSSQLKGKLVVWFIFLGNDLYENLQPNMDHYRMPFVRRINETGSWEIVTHHVKRTRWPFVGKRDYRRELAAICSPTFIAERAYSACEFLIKEGKDICTQAGAQLAVLTIPTKQMLTSRSLEILSSYSAHPQLFDPELPDKKIGDVCRNLGVTFAAGMQFLTAHDYKRRDPHWSAPGHRRIAQMLTVLHSNHLSETKHAESVIDLTK